MKVSETHLEGCFVIEPKVFEDDRGSFFFEAQYKKILGEENVQDSMPFKVVAFKNYNSGKKTVIESVEIVYKEYFNRLNTDTSILIPVWKVTTNNYNIDYFNMYTGEKLSS